jgi:hypothetical protein
VHPLVSILVVVSFVLIPLLNLKNTIIFITLVSIVIPKTQGIVIFGLDFHVFRLIILAGWIKIAFKKELKLGEMVKTDKAIIYWVIISFLVYVIQQNNFQAVINRLGLAYNAIGVYFLYRILIKRNDDVTILLDTLIVLMAVIAVSMINEQMTGRNIFNIFGLHEYSNVRMGKVRAQGPFKHSISAGMFGATLIPLCFSMWRHKWGNAFLGIIGTLSACLLVITSTSMTPLIACISGFVALLFWPLRHRMRIIKFLVISVAVTLQILLASPLWGVIKKLDFIKGANALHRFELLDNLINRIDEWFFLGSKKAGTWGIGTQDAANQYYAEAITGGFIKLALFIIIILFSFSIIGKKIKNTIDVPSQKRMWALGSALFANVVGFLGISYWDQMLIVWYLLLALITSTCLITDEKFLVGNNISMMNKTESPIKVST